MTDAKHEAPAEGAGEDLTAVVGFAAELREALEDLTSIVRGECPGILNEDSGGNGDLSNRIDDLIAQHLSFSALRARSSAPEARDVLALCRAISDDYQTSETHHPDHVLVRKDQFDALVSILNRQPEAREGEAVAWERRLFDETGEPGAWGSCQPPSDPNNLRPGRSIEYRPLYTHPAAPSADKLRIAMDAFDAITDLSTALRNGGPDSSDLQDLSDNLNTAVDLAVEALAALKAEGY